MKSAEELYNFDPSSRIDVALYETDSTEQQASQIFKVLKDDIFCIRMRQLIWKDFCRQKITGSSDLTTDVAALINENGIREILKTTTVKIFERSVAVNMQRDRLNPTKFTARKSSDELIDCVRQARCEWEQGINEELHAIVLESKRPFLLTRGPDETNSLLEVNLAKSSDQDSVKFLFDSEDLLETGIAIKMPNLKLGHSSRYMGLVKLNLNVMDIDMLSKKYIELSAPYTQLGLDENISAMGSKLAFARHEEAEVLSAAGDAVSARVFMRRGVPPSLRHKIYKTAFGLSSEVSTAEERSFARLRTSCDRMDMLTDSLLLHDIQTVTDDPRFFVFEEEIKDAIFSFSRDSYVLKNCTYEIHKPIFDLIDGGCAAPPCGVQPFLGFAMYFAPLCYVFKNTPSLYSVSREMFCRIWCKLNVLSADPETLLSICKTFECLLIKINPHLFMHMVNIRAQPLKIAFPWIQLGFVGLLEVDQLLHLWDRVIGYMDPTILAVAAAAIFIDRSDALFKSATEAEAIMILSEASRLRIIPLMQMLLFKDAAVSTSGSAAGR